MDATPENGTVSTAPPDQPSTSQAALVAAVVLAVVLSCVLRACAGDRAVSRTYPCVRDDADRAAALDAGTWTPEQERALWDACAGGPR